METWHMKLWDYIIYYVSWEFAMCRIKGRFNIWKYYDHNYYYQENISEDIDLIENMLKVDPNDRYYF